MTSIRAVAIALRLAWPHWLMPWRSPLLRWRLETYGIADASGRLLHADEIAPGDFFRFLRLRSRAVWRFLRWAASL
ncbi:MAG TPA: hypothetical protein VGB20_01695 [bacterium]